MKTLLFSLLVSLLLNSTIAQTWTQKSNIPPGSGISSRLASTSFSNYDTLAFVLGGLRGNTVYSDFWQYNSFNDTWLKKANFPGGPKYGHISFVIDSIAYVGFGSNQAGTLSTQFWAYNMNTDAWNTIASFPGDGRVYPSAITINSKGYVGGGIKFVSGNAIYLDDFWEYNPVLNTWIQKSDYPGGLRVGMIAFGKGNKGYMGYGESPGFFETDFYEYIPSTDTWTLLLGSPYTAISFGSAVTLGNKAYVIGGEFQHLMYTANVWEYDVSNNLWQPIISFPDTPRRNAISFVLNNDIYYGTGQIGANENNVTDDLWLLGNLSTTSINDRLSDRNIIIYPNPLQNNLTIESPDKIKTLKIYNTQGKIVYSQFNLKKNEINLSFLRSGIYLLKVETNTSLIINKRLIKK